MVRALGLGNYQQVGLKPFLAPAEMLFEYLKPKTWYPNDGDFLVKDREGKFLDRPFVSKDNVIM